MMQYGLAMTIGIIPTTHRSRYPNQLEDTLSLLVLGDKLSPSAPRDALGLESKELTMPQPLANLREVR